MAEDRDGPRVVRGLQQAGNELHLVAADDGGGLLQADVHLEPARQDVAELVPPAGGAGLVGEPEEVLALLLVHDAVQGEEVGDVTLLVADPAQFQPADLRVRGPDGFARGLARDVPGFAKPAKLRTEHDPQDGGTAPGVLKDAPDRLVATRLGGDHFGSPE